MNVSLESEHDRHTTGQYLVGVHDEPAKHLLPLALCSECGQEYVVASRSRRSSCVFHTARQEQDAADGDAVNDLYVRTDHPWPPLNPLGSGQLPDSWNDTDDGTPYVLPMLSGQPPRKIWLRPRQPRTRTGWTTT